MTIQDRNKELVQRLLSEVDTRGVSAIRTFCRPDCKMHWPSNSPPIDLEDYLVEVRPVREAFPDFMHEILESIAEGDFVAIRMTVRGTHKGEFLGMAATGKEVEFSATTMWRVADDKIVEYWGDSDMAGLYEQLGMVVKPSEEAPMATA
jgi:predicted ester cyclase